MQVGRSGSAVEPRVQRDEEGASPVKRARSLQGLFLEEMQQKGPAPSGQSTPPLSATPPTPLLRTSMDGSSPSHPASDETLIKKADRLFFACQYQEARAAILQMQDRPGWVMKRLAAIEALLEAKHPHKGEGSKTIPEKMANNWRYALKQQSEEKAKEFELHVGNLCEFNFGTIEHQPFELFNNSIGVAYTIGRRKTMEDAHFVSSITLTVEGEEHRLGVFGVLDGHGGTSAVEFTRQNLVPNFERWLTQCNRHSLTEEGIYQALSDCVIDLDNKSEPLRSGTTAVVAVRWRNKLFVANTGDCRAAASDTGIPVQLSHDAKLSEVRTRRKVMKCGGEIVLNNMRALVVKGKAPDDREIVLAVGGSIGDRYIKGKAVNGKEPVCILPAQPQITCYSLEGVQFIVLASDGFWDVTSTDQAVAAINKCQSSEEPLDIIAQRLVYSALGAESGDNITLMIIQTFPSQ